MKVYYAHCMSIYNTPQEQRDLKTLRRLGFKTVNPNSEKHEAGANLLGMAYFEKFADECDAIAFRALPDGSISAGVAKEIRWFRRRGKPVFELPSSILRRSISPEETKEYLQEVGER